MFYPINTELELRTLQTGTFSLNHGYLSLRRRKRTYLKKSYGECITKIGSTNYQEVADTLKNTSESIYFKHRLFVNPEINHGFCVALKQKDWKLIYTMPQSTFFTL